MVNLAHLLFGNPLCTPKSFELMHKSRFSDLGVGLDQAYLAGAANDPPTVNNILLSTRSRRIALDSLEMLLFDKFCEDLAQTYAIRDNGSFLRNIKQRFEVAKSTIALRDDVFTRLDAGLIGRLRLPRSNGQGRYLDLRDLAGKHFDTVSGIFAYLDSSSQESYTISSESRKLFSLAAKNGVFTDNYFSPPQVIALFAGAARIERDWMKQICEVHQVEDLDYAVLDASFMGGLVARLESRGAPTKIYQHYLEAEHYDKGLSIVENELSGYFRNHPTLVLMNNGGTHLPQDELSKHLKGLSDWVQKNSERHLWITIQTVNNGTHGHYVNEPFHQDFINNVLLVPKRYQHAIQVQARHKKIDGEGYVLNLGLEVLEDVVLVDQFARKTATLHAGDFLHLHDSYRRSMDAITRLANENNLRVYKNPSVIGTVALYN